MYAYRHMQHKHPATDTHRHITDLLNITTHVQVSNDCWLVRGVGRGWGVAWSE